MTLSFRIPPEPAAEFPVLSEDELFADDGVHRSLGELQGHEAGVLIEALTSWLSGFEPAA